MDNVIKEIISGCSSTFRTAPCYQYDRGRVLEFSGGDLADTFEVDFSNSPMRSSITQIGQNNRVAVPDQYFDSGEPIYVYLVAVGEDYAVTQNPICIIPILGRSARTNEQPAPEPQSVIGQAIAALNQGVEDAEAARDAIEDMSVSAASLPAESSATVTKSVDPETGAVSLAFGIPNGEKGDKGDTGATGPQGEPGDDYILTAQDKADIAAMVDAPVQDVQVNGTSVLSNGVANVPKAENGNLGVVKVSGGGLQIDSNGRISINNASDSACKTGTDTSSTLTPGRQHLSTFFGLAKAAGSDMASSSNPVGTYTDAAKVAIQKMLGIYEAPYELVNDFTLDSESSIELSADLNNIPYDFRNVLIRFYYPANTATASTGYGRYRFYDENNKFVYCETGKYSTNTAAQFKLIHVTRTGNMTMCCFTVRATTGSIGTWGIKDIGANSITFDLGNIVKIANVPDDVEPAGTRIQIYGQRAY